LNEVLLQKEKDSIFLTENFITDYRVEIKHFDKKNFKEWWSAMINENTPSIESFFLNFDLDKFQSKLLENKNDSLISFEKLNKRFIRIKDSDLKTIREQTKIGTDSDYQKHLNISFSNISKPVFNSSKDWAIFIKFSQNPYLDISSGGELFIYRKSNCKWVIYHKFYLWLN
jgi:hypothetical protein